MWVIKAKADEKKTVQLRTPLAALAVNRIAFNQAAAATLGMARACAAQVTLVQADNSDCTGGREHALFGDRRAAFLVVHGLRHVV